MENIHKNFMKLIYLISRVFIWPGFLKKILPPLRNIWKYLETYKYKYIQFYFFFSLQDVEGDHTVQLTFTMTEDLARKPYTLQVKNALGEQTYAFELASSKIPEPAGNYIMTLKIFR